jgi:CHAT domain-containing protein
LSPYRPELTERLLAVGAPAGVAAPLPQAAREIADAAGLFPNAATILSGAAATPEAVIAEIPGHTHLLFSTHGVAFEAGLPWLDRIKEPYLTLSADRQLTARQIQTLDMRSVRFVALSACQTEVGQTFEGDEVFSLARAFLVAGVSNVLVSLLKVPDLSTPRIVVGTLRELRGGKTAAAALRLALEAYLNDAGSGQARRPIFWAPWLLIGRAS